MVKCLSPTSSNSLERCDHTSSNSLQKCDHPDDHIFGFGEFGEIPARDANSKYFVSWEVYPNSTYDNFVDGI